MDALRTHVKEKIQILVVINSPWGPLREAFLSLSEALGVRSAIPPQDRDADNKTYGSHISRNHSAALNWVWHKIILTISFDPIIYKNVQLDSGGALAAYFDRHFAFEYYIRHGTRSFLLSIRALLLLF